MRNHITFLLLFPCLLLNAQKYTADRMNFCGTEHDDRFVDELKTHSGDLAVFDRTQLRTPLTDYPVTVHILRKSDGTGGIDVDSFLTELELVNAHIAPSGVALQICGEINFVDSDQYYDFYKPDENNLYYSTRVANTMNLYISNSLTYASGAVRCGYAYFPGWKDMVMIDRHCIVDGTTFTHEVGHYFGLFHTHGNEISTTDELNNQSNCMITGDDVCDTPADPLLTYTVDSATCQYIGDGLDDNDEPYFPDPANIMSYAPKHCKVSLSEGQYNRMAYVAAFLRDYMLCQPISAEFVLDEVVGICGDEHQVHATYTGAAEELELMWNIDSDSVPDAETPVAEFTFTTPGRHDICLTATANADTVRKCKSFAVLGSASGPHVINVNNNADCALINNDNDHGWTVVNLDSATSEVLMMDNFHYNTSGEEDQILICPLDLTGMESPSLHFELAYVPYSAQRTDALRVEVSTDCGQTFDELFFGSGLDISSTGDYAGEQWQPFHAQDWQQHLSDLTDYTNQSVVLRFTNITGHGNYMYVKNIAISDIDPLPLTFISLAVTPTRGGAHEVVWKTADESGVSAFVVERSRDGVTFQSVGEKIPENGPLNNYSVVVDGLPGVIYYRIRVDFQDGTSEYSPIAVTRDLEQKDLVLYPNPAAGKMQIRGLDAAVTSTCQIYDAAGRTVERYVSQDQTVDVSDLIPGIYTLSVNGLTKRFVKVSR